MPSLKPLRVLVTLVATVLVANACGGDDVAEDDGVATLQDTTVVTEEAPQRQDIDEAVLDFTQCLRDEGIEVPDIALGADGAPQLDPAQLQDLDLDSAEFQTAFDTCIGIIADSGAFSLELDPEIEAIIQDQLQAFAECMRREGIEDFPDPQVGGNGLPFPASAFTRVGDEGFQTALDTCQQETAFDGLDE